MLSDHVAQAFILPNQVSWYILHATGRLAAPIFFWGIADGYDRSRSLEGYAKRLALLAIISQLPFTLIIPSPFWTPLYLNVVFTLLIALGCLHALTRLGPRRALPLIIVLLAISCVCDWGPIGPLYAIALHSCKQDRSWRKAISWTIPIATYVMLVLFGSTRGSPFVGAVIINLPQVFAVGGVAVVHMTASQPKPGQTIRRATYLFYPMHLLVLTIAAMLWMH